MLNYNILLMAQQCNEPIYAEAENIPVSPPHLPHLLNTYILYWRSSVHWIQMLPCMLKLKISATDRLFLLHWSQWYTPMWKSTTDILRA